MADDGGSDDDDFGKVTDWVLSKWDKGSFDTAEESVGYHWPRHGMMRGKAITEYRLEPIKAGDGSLGWRIYKGPEEPVGVYTSRG